MKSSLIQPSLSRDFAILTGSILFVLLILSLWITWSTHAEQSTRIIDQLEKETDRIDRTLEREMHHASYLLDAIGKQIRGLEQHDNRGIAKILQTYQSHNRVYAIWAWTDATQSVVVSSNKGVLDEPVDVSDRDYVHKSALEPWVLQIGAPIEGRVSDRWVIPVSVGVTDETGHYLGSITASLDINEITEEISDLVRRPGISFAILNKRLIKLSEVSTTPNFVDTYFSHQSLERINFTKSPSGVVSYASLFSDDDIYAFYKLSDRFPYIVLVGYDTQYGQDAIQRQLLPRLLQVISIAAFALLFLWIVRARIIRPVVDLTNITADLARGVPYEFKQRPAPLEIDMLAKQIANVSLYVDERKRLEVELREKLEIELSRDAKVDLTSQTFTSE